LEQNVLFSEITQNASNVLEISESDAKSLVQGCVYIIEQAAYRALKPSLLEQQLCALDLNDEHV
jgi:hypothetical protein